MAEVPVPLQELNNITESVARLLLEDWAINDRFKEDELEQATQNAVSDTVFVIGQFMEQFNALVAEKARESKII